MAVDEACLALKLFWGHVDSLIGKCEYILIPQVSNFGRYRELRPRFAALYDMAVNTFREREQKFLAFRIDIRKNENEAAAFAKLGQALGVSAKRAKGPMKRQKKRVKECGRREFKRKMCSMEPVA